MAGRARWARRAGRELDRARAAAHRPPTWFASRDEANARYLRISDLAGLLAADHPAVQGLDHNAHVESSRLSIALLDRYR